MRTLFLLALLLPAACANSDPARFSDKPPSLRVAQAAMAGGVPEAALSVARRLLASNRDDVGALLMEGQALTEMGELAKAEGAWGGQPGCRRVRPARSSAWAACCYWRAARRRRRRRSMRRW